jgi:hypothetical protein
MKQELHAFISDGCTGFPDLWIRDCCVAHDRADFDGVEELTADLEFMKCVVEESMFLGPLSYVFGGLLLAGLFIFRPIYKKYKKGKKSGKIKGVKTGDLNQ